MFHRFVSRLGASLVIASSLVPALAIASPGVTENQVLIGQTVSMTGQVAGSVRELNQGANAYIDMVNRRGGVHGRKITLVTLDDAFDPALAAKNAQILVQKRGVFAMFLNRATPHTEAMLPTLAADGVPLVAPSTGAAIFHDPPNRLIFNVRAKYQDEVRQGVEHFSVVGLRDIGIAYVDDSFGRDSLQGFQRAMDERRLTPKLELRFSRVDPDVPAAAQQILSASPKALIIVGSATTTSELIRNIRAAGNQMQIMTLSNNSSAAFVKNLGKDGVGIIVSQVTPPAHLVSTQLGQELKAAAEASGATLSYAAMEGFVAAKVLVEGLRRAGRNLSRERFIR